ncbi:gnat family acetyltransferase [Diplodia corticola]|uniref:Gnat family acetyltransferase n=1 Tax=Diplodia corticola TaxID=236234 RepID=A0A1J9SC66_9PEZI|nr:gnat family acetyltransferase [Diplodia corticola]OJD37428.1 gnat family acetyltransferase [Diplodia corticola]
MAQSQQDNRPLGPAVEPRPALTPEHKHFHGEHVTLRPLAPSDLDALLPLISGPDKAWLFDYMPDGPIPASSGGQDTYRAVFASKCASKDPLFFSVLVKGQVLGWIAIMRIDAGNGVAEIGHVMFSPPLQRTAAATEAVYLLARYVFEDLRYRRLEWKTNDLNEASKRAAVRLGFTWEGRFRAHMVAKGRRRDTVWFSMIEEDWFGRDGKGGAGEALKRWLDEANFDSEGKQRKKLEDMRRDVVGGVCA